MELMPCGQRQRRQERWGEVARCALARCMRIMAWVRRVAALDFAAMALASTAAGGECARVLEQRAKPALTQSRPLWGERPQSAAGCDGSTADAQ
jgi:hypothetical protein